MIWRNRIRIHIRIRTNIWRIREAQKITDPNPQYCQKQKQEAKKEKMVVKGLEIVFPS